MPDLGVILVVPHQPDLLIAFDGVSRGIKLHAHESRRQRPGAGADVHAEAGEYYPEIIHLVRLDRAALVSSWDIERSYARLVAAGQQARQAAQDVTYFVGLDNTTGILLERMNRIARLIGLISLLLSLPLLWMAWVLLGSLAGLLLLNERRKLGLLRLRGVPGAALGRSLLVAIGSGGLAGGVAGALAGTALPILIYAGGWLPWETLMKVQPPYLLATFLAIGVGMSLLGGRRLVGYAARISPLEASGRVAPSEAAEARIRFGPVQFAALLFGTVKVVGWIGAWSFTSGASMKQLHALDRALDFLAFPLFVYGATTLLVSRQAWLAGLLRLPVRLVGGRLAEISLRHIATRPHRVAGFLVIVALMATISLYPTVMTAVFDNKMVRGARLQLGSDLHVTLNAPDLVPAGALGRGGLAERVGLLEQRLRPLVSRLESLEGVQAVEYLIEGLAEGVYMRGYGFNGIPIYLVDRPRGYLASIYREEALGENAPFTALVDRLANGEILLSPALAAYWQRGPGDLMPVGRDVHGTLRSAPLAGTVRTLPGIPLRTVNDRDSFVGARIDYLNYLFSTRAFVVAAAGQPGLADLDVLIPRVVLTVRSIPGVAPEALRDRVVQALPAHPLEVRELEGEIARLGSDMYIFLARQNFQIYLLGGLLLAVIGILAVALANYAEDRRTLVLLRIRGCGPRQMLRFSSASLLAPSAVGLVFGALVSLIVGYGITNVVWLLRELRTILTYLPTRLVVSERTALVAALLVLLLVAIALASSRWVFRKTARESLAEG